MIEISSPTLPGRLPANLLLLALSLLVSALPIAAHAETPQAGDRLLLAEATTREDLQLFWEEKDLIVHSATRTDKPLYQTAENMVVITARDIEAMNAHSVDEVLSRVPGVFVEYGIPDFVSYSNVHIQGSRAPHVAVHLDGVPLNLLSGETSVSFLVPLQIIERIEIVKGAASSVWGSALGGVINIITKEAGDTVIPRGGIYGSAGEARSFDYGGELHGRAGALGYYLHASHQESEGLQFAKYAKNGLFGKVAITPVSDLTLTVTAGYMDPTISYAPPAAVRFGQNLAARLDAKSLLLNGEGEYRLSDEFKLNVNLYYNRLNIDTSSSFIQSNQLFTGLDSTDKTIGGSLRLSHNGETHNWIVGGEGINGAVTSTTSFGPLIQGALGLPASSTVYPEITRYALFANDTVTLGPVSITPGLRYDHNDIAGGFLSPSLGIAWKLAEHTVARASVARGFTTPILTQLQGGGPQNTPNPDLDPERVWSYQAGLESGVVDFLNLSATYFRHDMKDELTPTALPSGMQFVVNGGEVRRQGYELGLETVPAYNLSLKGGFSYVHVSPDISQPQDIYATQLRLRYDDRKSLLVDLYGQQTWWDLDASQGGKYNNFIWDLTGTKRFELTDTTTAEVFFSVHNLFSGSSYTYYIFPNPQRWVEGGLRFKF